MAKLMKPCQMLEQRVRLRGVFYRSGISGNNKILVALSFRKERLRVQKYCKTLENHNTLYKELPKPGSLSTALQNVWPTSSGPAALSATTSSHSATNRRRSPATRHDAPAVASPATPANPGRGRQSWHDFRPIYKQAQTTSF